MATEILRPNAQGDKDELVLSIGGSTKWGAMSDGLESSYCVYPGVTEVYKKDLYELPSHSVGLGTINKVTIYFSAMKQPPFASAAYAKPSLKTNSVETDGDEISLPGAYTTYSQAWTTNPVTELPWTWDDINALQIG